MVCKENWIEGLLSELITPMLLSQRQRMIINLFSSTLEAKMLAINLAFIKMCREVRKSIFNIYISFINKNTTI